MPSKKTALSQLNKLVGTWRTRGTMLSGPDSGKPSSGSDIYKWLPGNTFLQHTWNVRMPDGQRRGIEILGFDPERKTIYAHAYDADGSLTSSRVAFHGNTFQIVDDQMSFKGRIDKSGTSMSGTWSTTDNADPIMEVNFTAAGRKV